ncbi:hypothetical protein Zmor_016475 [Zophobas morio]|uniref:Alpha-acetolactate decarboxylase n=1 Tax=Zophobas morio TaxID=2755281 RepID=A0AA38HK86_9CUCU|nr:hypothetical protein Zmor_016475 [Zophobas morio]
MKNKLFQYSTITSLVQGNYDGELVLSEAAIHGNFGLGTFHALDGEMIALDGVFYQMLSDGTVSVADKNIKSPFLSLCEFSEVDKTLSNANVTSENLLEKIELGDNQNKVAAIKIKGNFKKVSTRTVARQEKPYKKMYEINNLQSDLVFENVEGTIVGFYTPKFLNTIGVEGIHCHFINNKFDQGGHVKSFEIENAIVEIKILNGVNLAFGEKPFASEDLQAHIKKVEGER